MFLDYGITDLRRHSKREAMGILVCSKSPEDFDHFEHPSMQEAVGFTKLCMAWDLLKRLVRVVGFRSRGVSGVGGFWCVLRFGFRLWTDRV